MGLKVSCHIAECAKDLETKFSIMPFYKIKSNLKVRAESQSPAILWCTRKNR
jgi:hypothetical protein